jgi:hypothetical protein
MGKQQLYSGDHIKVFEQEEILTGVGGQKHFAV